MVPNCGSSITLQSALGADYMVKMSSSLKNPVWLETKIQVGLRIHDGWIPDQDILWFWEGWSPIPGCRVVVAADLHGEDLS